MKIVFLVGHALGHVARSLSIAQALFKLIPDADVHFVSPASGHAERLVLPPLHYHDIPYEDRGGRLFKFNLEAKLASLQPDMICLDLTPLPWLYQVELNHPKIIYLTNFFLFASQSDITRQETLFAANSTNWNEARRSNGMPELMSAKELYKIGHTICCDPVGLVPTNIRQFGKLKIAGACAWEPPAKSVISLPEDARVLVIALGSTGRYRPSKAAVAKIREALDCTQTVLFSSSADNFDLGEVLHFSNGPITPFLRQSPLAVTQGGTGSTYLALNSGTPTAIFPSFENHEVLAKYMTEAEVGCMFSDLADMSPDKIADTVNSMTTNCEAFRTDNNEGPACAAAILTDILRNTDRGLESELGHSLAGYPVLSK